MIFYLTHGSRGLFLSEFVTKDAQVLSALRRYARGSLALIFLKRWAK